MLGRLRNYFRFRQCRDFLERPHVIRNPRCHRGCDSERLVDAGEVVVHVVERYGRFVVLDLLGEAIREPGESAHPHPHREILALDVAGTDMRHLWIAKPDDLLAAVADCRAVALLPFGGVAEVLHELRVVNLVGEGIDDGIEVDLVAVRGELHAVGKAAAPGPR